MIQIEDAEVGFVAEFIVAALIDSAARESGASVWIKLLAKCNRLAVKVVALGLHVLPKRAKDAKIASMIAGNSRQIEEQINQFLSQKALPLTVTGITVFHDDCCEITFNLCRR